MLRYSLPRVTKRGYGLGNEMIPWARAFLAARLLGARLLTPAFALNRRGYWRHFQTPLDDWIQHRVIERLLPTIEFTEADYLEFGGDDLLAALRGFAAQHRLYTREAYVLTTSGMWGGLRHVAPARDFMRSTLYLSRFAAGNLLNLQTRISPEKILVGMHVRLGDFRPAGELGDFGKVANMSLPLAWFQNIAASLTVMFGDALQVLLVSDGSPEQLRPLTSSVPCLTTWDLPNSDCSDLLALANSDLIVCSASTFSSLAAFISDSPYLCFAPNLTLHPEGCYSMGDFSHAQGAELKATAAAVAGFAATPSVWLPRGFAVELDGVLPPGLEHAIAVRRARRQWRFDLASHGVCPSGGASPSGVVSPDSMSPALRLP